jgi:hypothetical protein
MRAARQGRSLQRLTLNVSVSILASLSYWAVTTTLSMKVSPIMAS